MNVLYSCDAYLCTFISCFGQILVLNNFNKYKVNSAIKGSEATDRGGLGRGNNGVYISQLFYS